MADKPSPALPSCDEFDPNSLHVDQALNAILNTIPPITDVERIALDAAYGRVLAEAIISSIDVPAYTNSAMDGYAIVGNDIPSDAVARLQVVGTILAGKPMQTAIKSGECARIMTGGKMPAGADTVIMQEHVQREGDVITITHGHKLGQNVRQAGEDLAKGDTVFTPGRQLTPADVGMIASMGIAEVSVFRRPRVAFFSTGDEICEVGKPLAEGQIYDSNRYSVLGMLKRLDVDIVDLGIIPDDRAAIETAFHNAVEQADVLITTGGVSVGEADFVKETLEKIGEVGFWKIAMKPGRPLAFGHIGNCQFFGLPGNPVSAMVTFYQFVHPAILRMQGNQQIGQYQLQLKTESRLKKRAGRLEFQRGVMFTNDAGELVVRSTGSQGSGMLSSMGNANCFIVLPLECEAVAAGETVLVQPFAGLI